MEVTEEDCKVKLKVYRGITLADIARAGVAAVDAVDTSAEQQSDSERADTSASLPAADASNEDPAKEHEAAKPALRIASR